MQIKDIFETRIEEKIEPVIKVGERQDEKKLASEIGSYVVTPTIERYLDDFLEHYSDTFNNQTTEIGVWISGYFGSGKSHIAKIAALLVENRILDGIPATKRIESRIPADAPHRNAIVRSLGRFNQCDSQVIAFNLNSLADSKSTPLPKMLLSQFYQSKGYGANFIYARVIEAELDKLGKLNELHTASERLAKKGWQEIQKNLNFYARHLYQAACEVAPEMFAKPEDVAQALKNAESGEFYNVQFFVQTVLDDLETKNKKLGKPCRLVLVMDESGQWIEDDGGRLAQLQALVEEAAIKGQGKIWLIVTTHEDMGSVYQNARALKGDMKKIEGRFRFKWNLTTENIELVLEDRIFRKKLTGKTAVANVYKANPGVLCDLGQLKSDQHLPECSEERFTTFYPFFPYQIHLIPEIVKSLRSAGGRGEQLSGSTRTLLAITQDILRSGRREYLKSAVGEMVSFDEVYHNLAGEGEVNPDARRELSRIVDVAPGATLFTRRVAEVLYLIREISYIPRTIDNLARLLVENTSDGLSSIINRVKPELQKLISARIVAQIGEEYEFLTGERRTFEDAVANEAAQVRWQDLENGFARYFTTANILGFETIPYKGNEFRAMIFIDSSKIVKEGFTSVKVSSPLAAIGGVKISDIENQSLLPEEQHTVFVWCPSISGFDTDLKRYLAMRRIIDMWKGDPHLTEESRKLASERDSNDLEKLRRKVQEGIMEGLKTAHIIFRGSGRTVMPKPGISPGDVLRNELSAFWPTLYPKYERVPVKIVNEQRAIPDILSGKKDLAHDVRELRLFDNGGQIDPQSPLIDAIRIYLSTKQCRNERSLGKDILQEFEKPPYGWDPGAVRVGVAAMVRAGLVRVHINKKPFTNPLDGELQDALRVSRNFDRVELVLEETEVDPEALTKVRSLLIKLTGKRKIDETPAALAMEMENFGKGIVEKAEKATLWAEPAGLPLPDKFKAGKEIFENILSLTNPMHCVMEAYNQREHLQDYTDIICTISDYIGKWGRAFTSMRDFAGTLSAIEHKLPSHGACASFLNNWNTATEQANIIDKDIWTDLQNAQATASLELEQFLSFCHDNIKKLQEDFYAEVKQLNEKYPENEEIREWIETGTILIDSFSSEKEPVRISSQAERLSRLLEQGQCIVQQVERSVQEKDKVPGKSVRKIKLGEVFSSKRIQTEAQWDQIRDRLDEEVRRELAEGNEVEFL